jgi:hypothetical protein
MGRFAVQDLGKQAPCRVKIAGTTRANPRKYGKIFSSLTRRPAQTAGFAGRNLPNPAKLAASSAQRRRSGPAKFARAAPARFADAPYGPDANVARSRT